MALVLADRVRELTNTVGTGAVTLAGAVNGFQTFSAAIGNTNTTYYAIANATATEWEVGIGTYSSGTNSLSRDTVLASSNANALVNFSVGAKDVFCTQPAERNVYVVGTDVVAANSAKVPNTLLANSSVTFNGTTVALGASGTLTANTPNALTFNNGGAGAVSGTTFNGGAAQTISYNTVGAPSTTGTNASGTWGISVTGNAGTVTNGVYTTGSYADPAWITSINYSKLTGTVPTWNQNTTGTAANVTGTVAIANGGSGATTAAQALINLGERTGATGSAILPSGTTAQRDGTPATGYIRFNTTITKFEGYNGSAWAAVGGGATGGGSDAVFVENDQVVTASYTITTGKNASSVGPITINSGVQVQIPTGSVWVVL